MRPDGPRAIGDGAGGAASYPKRSASRFGVGRSGRILPRVLTALLWVALCIPTAGPLLGCRTTPVTGRRALNFFSPTDDVQLGTEAYEEITGSQKLIRSGAQYDMVVRAMNRLAAVADDEGWQWEVRLIDDDSMVNAFALPGGKMAVYTGILPVCQDETGLAVVMGHEIGHVVARHGTERMSRSVPQQVLLQAIDLGEYGQLAGTFLDVAWGLPHGRSQESEADHIGLVYMARAGYDPRAAVAFWERMNSLSSGGGPPEFLSTHPSHETRVEQLEELMPAALAEYTGP